MTQAQYEQYRRELNTPYTDEELELHLMDRDAKSLLEVSHAENFFLIRLVMQWIDYVHHGGPRPARNVWKYLMPGNNTENSACDRLNQLVEFFLGFAYGQGPVLAISFFCSRSTMTLIRKLEELCYTKHLDTAERAAKDFFTLITGESRTEYTREQLESLLRKCVDDFVSAFEQNARELHEYLLDFIRGNKRQKPATPEDVKKIVKAEAKSIKLKQDTQLTALAEIAKTTTRIDNREKKTRRNMRAHYSPEELDQIHLIWIAAQANQTVRANSKRRPSLEAAYCYYHKELRALGVVNTEMFSTIFPIELDYMRP